jgi:glycosyltransferase involved in cell wall biosynthesis
MTEVDVEGPRYFLDVSSLINHLKNARHFTGIQRVLVMLVLRLSEQVGANRVYLSYYDDTTSSYRACTLGEVGGDEIADAERFRSIFHHRNSRRVLTPLVRYKERPLKYHFHRVKLSIAAWLGLVRVFRRYQVDIAEWRNITRRSNEKRVNKKRKQPESFIQLARRGDFLLVIDSSWTVVQVATAFEQARRDGVAVVVMVHDLIPIMAPSLVPYNAPFTFLAWLQKTTQFSSLYLTNSQKTKSDLDAFLESNDTNIRSIAVPLAQEGLVPADSVSGFSPSFGESGNGIIRDIHRVGPRIRAMSYRPYVLFVGTLETRKNVWRMAQAWKLLLEEHGPDIPSLVLVGRHGWFNEDFEEFKRSIDFPRGWIFHVESPSDQELAFLYRNADFGLMVSIYEGWGLPIGEALSYGKTSVVGSTTSLPEVGGDLVRYCDPTSIKDIASACAEFIKNPNSRIEYEDRIAKHTLRSWHDVTCDVLTALNSGLHLD